MRWYLEVALVRVLSCISTTFERSSEFHKLLHLT